jgi:hypothetical protein
VRREHRTIAPDGKLESWSSDVRDARERAVASMSRQPRDTAAADQSATTPAESAPVASRLAAPQGRDSARGGSSSADRTARPDPTEADLAELERLERRAKSAGIIPLTVDPL